MQKKEAVLTPKKQNLCELQFAKDYGFLGQIVLSSFKENTNVPESYTGRVQEYYIKLSIDFIEQLHNGITRFVLTALLGNSASTVKMDKITNSIMVSLMKIP